MVDDYAVRRREYVAEIRKSFDGEMDGKEEAADSEIPVDGLPFLILKIKFFVAACILVSFLFCKYNGYDFYRFTPSEVIEMISDNQYYTKLQNYVMIQEQDSENGAEEVLTPSEDQ